MAWIKMRSDLSTHPKVVRISSALKADRLRVIGGLHAVWCLFDAHSVDGILSGYTLEALDDLIGWPGFSAAMIDIEWLENDGISLVTPDFDEHNSQSAKRRAQEAERKRTVRNVSAFDADKKRTREEKRREEKDKDKSKDKAPPASLPDWLPLESWTGYLDMRKKQKKVPTERAIELVLKALDAMRATGQDIAAVLDKSTSMGWTDVYPIRDDRRERQGNGRPSLNNIGVPAGADADIFEQMRRELPP